MDGKRKKWSAPKRLRWTAADGRELLAAITRSGLSDTQFAREHGIARHRVEYWRKKQREATGASFVPVAVVASQPSPAAGVSLASVPAAATVEVELGGGRRLRFTGNWDTAAIKPWLTALGSLS